MDDDEENAILKVWIVKIRQVAAISEMMGFCRMGPKMNFRKLDKPDFLQDEGNC
jgi:hypothetical protein